MTQLCAVRDFFDRIAPEYDQMYKDNISQWENKIIQSVLYSVLSKGKSWILDIGCGTGLGYDLSLRSIYVGVDISGHMLRIGKYQFPDASFIMCDAAELPFRTSAFDTIISLFGSLCHLNRLNKTFQEIFRVLRPNGRCLLMFYSRWSPYRIYRSKGRALVITEGLSPLKRGKSCNKVYTKLYTLSELQELVKPFKVLHVFGLNAILELPGLRHLLSLLGFHWFHLIDTWLTKSFPQTGYYIMLILEKREDGFIGDIPNVESV